MCPSHDVVPVQFHFDHVSKLRQYDTFTVEKSFVARPNKRPSSATLFSVVGKAYFGGRREVVAEFPNESHAMIFRDMCEAVTAR